MLPFQVKPSCFHGNWFPLTSNTAGGQLPCRGGNKQRTPKLCLLAMKALKKKKMKCSGVKWLSQKYFCLCEAHPPAQHLNRDGENQTSKQANKKISVTQESISKAITLGRIIKNGSLCVCMYIFFTE